MHEMMNPKGLPNTSTYLDGCTGVLVDTGGFLSSRLLAVRLRRAPIPAMCPPLKLVASSDSLNEVAQVNVS